MEMFQQIQLVKFVSILEKSFNINEKVLRSI